jgi:hypothetical protein
MIFSQFSPASVEDGKHAAWRHVAQTGRGTHRRAFHEAVQNHQDFLFGEANVGVKWLLALFREPSAALLALVPLYVVASFSSFDRSDAAIVTRH